MRRYTTELRGALWLDDFGFDLRIVREDSSPLHYALVTGSMLGTQRFSTVDEARANVEASVADCPARIEWLASLEVREREVACFICGIGAGQRLEASERYPQELCPACTLEAVDENGRELRFENDSPLGGGFVAVAVDSGERRRSHVCFVRGRKCWADEARFSGVVVVPFEWRFRATR